MKKLIYGILFLALVGIAIVGCSKEDMQQENNDSAAYESSPEQLYANSKTIEIRAKDGTTANMVVFADNEADLNAYSSENFVLFDIQGEESLDKALVRNKLYEEGKAPNEDVDDSETNSIDEDVKAKYAFQLQDLKSTSNANYAVMFNSRDNTKHNKWKFYDIYSPVPAAPLSVHIIATNWLWRVYYKASYKAYQSSPWTPIGTSKWRRAGLHGTSFSKTPCFQYRVRIKAKKSSVYVVNFS